MVVKVILEGYRGAMFEIHVCDTEEQLQGITVLQLKEKMIDFWKRPASKKSYLPNSNFT